MNAGKRNDVAEFGKRKDKTELGKYIDSKYRRGEEKKNTVEGANLGGPKKGRKEGKGFWRRRRKEVVKKKKDDQDFERGLERK